MDYFGLVEAVDRLGEGVVVAVADAAHGRLNACLGQTLGVADADVLRTPVTNGERGLRDASGRRSCSACSSASSTKLA